MTRFSLQFVNCRDKFRTRSQRDIIAVTVLVPELEPLRDEVPFADLERGGREGEDEVDPQGSALGFARGSERNADVAWRRSHCP